MCCSYNQAIKLKEVAVPFVYVQYQALLLFFFTIASPFAVPPRGERTRRRITPCLNAVP